MNNEPVAWLNKDDSSLSFKNHGGGWQPLYTQQYERPHNTVLVPCDKLAEMLHEQQQKLTKYELRHAEQRKRIEELEKEVKHWQDAFHKGVRL